jgi:hypothetical protein
MNSNLRKNLGLIFFDLNSKFLQQISIRIEVHITEYIKLPLMDSSVEFTLMEKLQDI